MGKTKHLSQKKRRKPFLNEERVKVIASTFLLNAIGRNLKLMGVNKPSIEEWIAMFDASDNEDSICDGPILVVVNDKTGEARFFNQFFEEMMGKSD